MVTWTTLRIGKKRRRFGYRTTSVNNIQTWRIARGREASESAADLATSSSLQYAKTPKDVFSISNRVRECMACASLVWPRCCTNQRPPGDVFLEAVPWLPVDSFGSKIKSCMKST